MYVHVIIYVIQQNNAQTDYNIAHHSFKIICKNKRLCKKWNVYAVWVQWLCKFWAIAFKGVGCFMCSVQWFA